MTKEAFENAIATVMALGGSTNAVLHLLAIANEARVELRLDDFARIGRSVPHLADMKPHGRFHMTDLDRIGGVPVVLRELLSQGLLHGDCLTVTGKTMAENLEALDPPAPDGSVVHLFAEPIHADGGIAILRGSLAPEGAVVKMAGIDGELAFDRPGTGLRRRGRRHGGHPRRDGDARDSRRHPLRGAEGRPGHARDAGGDRGHDRRRARRRLRACHRRPLLRRHAGLLRRPRGSRGRASAVRSRSSRTGTRSSSTPARADWTSSSTATELERRRGQWKPPAPALHDRGARQVRAASSPAPSGAPITEALSDAAGCSAAGSPAAPSAGRSPPAEPSRAAMFAPGGTLCNTCP